MSNASSDRAVSQDPVEKPVFGKYSGNGSAGRLRESLSETYADELDAWVSHNLAAKRRRLRIFGRS